MVRSIILTWAIILIVITSSLIVVVVIDKNKDSFEEEIKVCEEVDSDIFQYNTTNHSDYLRATSAWQKYNSMNELEGYCKDGERIGGLV